MYYLSAHQLREQLATHRLPPSQSLQYLMGFLLIGPTPILFLPLPKAFPWMIVPRVAAGLLVLIIGARYCYRKARASQDFAERFIAMGFVVAVRLLLAFTVTFCLGMVAAAIAAALTDVNVFERLPPQQSQAGAWLGIAALVGWHSLYFWRLGVHLGRIPLASHQTA